MIASTTDTTMQNSTNSQYSVRCARPLKSAYCLSDFITQFMFLPDVESTCFCFSPASSLPRPVTALQPRTILAPGCRAGRALGAGGQPGDGIFAHREAMAV